MRRTGRAASIAEFHRLLIKRCSILPLVLISIEPALSLPSPLALTQAAEPAVVAGGPTIRVRLSTSIGPVSLSGEDLRVTGHPIALGPYGAIRISFRKLDREWSEWTVWQRDGGGVLARVKARRFEVSGRNLRLNLKPTPGRLTLVPHGKSLQIVAELELESYVRGVLPAEMPSTWPLEALKAQAIAARTYALFRKAAAARAAYDLDASVMDQMYLFPENSVRQANAARAVAATRGQILVNRRPPLAPLAAYFHADCGGQTEDASAVWGTVGAGTAIDKGCPVNPLANWRLAIKLSEIAERLRVASGKSAGQRLESLARDGSTASGRVERLKLGWSDGETTTIASAEFRMLIGHERLKSTNFELNQNGREIVLTGKGFGHGVGLCQWGARHMARAGADYRSILGHYYPRALMADVEALAAGRLGPPLASNSRRD